MLTRVVAMAEHGDNTMGDEGSLCPFHSSLLEKSPRESKVDRPDKKEIEVKDTLPHLCSSSQTARFCLVASTFPNCPLESCLQLVKSSSQG
jgi:hypothetical protein